MNETDLLKLENLNACKSCDLSDANLENASDTITVTVHKEWIQDVNGNPLDANYSYTFTTGS